MSALRIGKHIELELDADTPGAAVERAATMAEVLLANPVIEDFAVRLDDRP